jgi:hypothetical protein
VKLYLKSYFRLIVLMAGFIFFAASPPDPVDSAMQSITAERLAAHVRFLANDLLEGRGTGTRGYDIAALYLATQLKELGLVAGGENGTYQQQVPLQKADLDRDRSSIEMVRDGNTIPFKLEEDCLISPDYGREEISVSAGVVFAGFGVTAPEFHYDDFANLDAKGKIAIILSGSPDAFPLNEHAYYSSSAVKDSNLAAHGVVGYLVFNNPVDEKRRSWERSVRQSRLSSFRWLQPDGRPSLFVPQIRGHAFLSHAGAEKIFQGRHPDLKEIFQMWSEAKLRSFVLPIELKMKTVTKREKGKSSNVVGMLQGSDPQLKNQYIVYTAHVDHLGISDPLNGDRVNNGAYDNATGVSALIEIARAFRQLGPRPRRSIIFLGVTGEEKGLQGSEYFANYPTVPRGSVVADINMDMFLMLYQASDMVTIGAEHSSLGPTAAREIAKVGLSVGPDPFKEEVIFIRSDQYSFIKKGIPSIMFMTGFHSTDPSIDGSKVTLEWLRTIYHTPQDDVSQKMVWSTGVKVVQSAFLTGLAVTTAAQAPSWNEADFFGTKFAH